MIKVENVSKSFGDIRAVNHVEMEIEDAQLFGLIGTNGAGKSTLLRMMAGVFKPDEGTIRIDGMPVYQRFKAKEDIYFISDEPYFFANAAPQDMEQYLSGIYSGFRMEDFYRYLDRFGLDRKRKINTYSKGMKKQLALLCGICSGTKYLYCDETFDGLDPVMRQGVKSILAEEIDERGMTPVIASHNLRELEDICDHIGLLHQGGVLLSEDLASMKCKIQKVQCVFTDASSEADVIQGLEIVKREQRGALLTYTIRGEQEEVGRLFAQADTVFCEMLPLTLEEIFIVETEVKGYDIQKIIGA